MADTRTRQVGLDIEQPEYRLNRDLMRQAAANLNTEAERLTDQLQTLSPSNGRLYKRVVERRHACWRAAKLLQDIADGDY